MKLPAKLTLGNKTKKPNLVLGGAAQSGAKEEEKSEPKYSSG